MIPLRGGDPKVLLTWDNIPGADSYTVTVSKDSLYIKIMYRQFDTTKFCQ